MKIWIGCDHAGYALKLEVLAMLLEQNYTVEDLGCDGSRPEYPEIAPAHCVQTIFLPNIQDCTTMRISSVWGQEHSAVVLHWN